MVVAAGVVLAVAATWPLTLELRSRLCCHDGKRGAVRRIAGDKVAGLVAIVRPPTGWSGDEGSLMTAPLNAHKPA